MTRLTIVDHEPNIGPTLHDLARDQAYLDFYPLDDAAELDRPGFFCPDTPDPGVGPFGHPMLQPEFRHYRTDVVVAYALADVHVIGADGIVVLGGGVLRGTLDHVSTWLPECCVQEFRRDDYLRLRRPMPVSRFVTEGRYLIGFAGAWRSYSHWLLQCLPKLYAFTLLRRRFRDLKLVLPPLPPGSPQQRTLDLLGITSDAVFWLPPQEVTGFAAAIVLPNFDIWGVAPFVASAADQLVAGVPDAPAAGSGRVYLHRAARGRQLSNFAAVRRLVEEFGFTVHSFEDTDLAAQIAIMRTAREVISEHDEASASIVFCEPGGRVLELFNPFCVQPATWSVAARRGLGYGYLVGSHNTTRASPAPGWYSDYDIPLEALRSALQRMVGRSAAPQSAAAPPAPAAPAPLPPAPEPPGTIRGITEPVFEVAADIGQFGRSGVAERLTVFAPAVPPPQIPLHREGEMPGDFVAEHYQYAPPISVNVYALPGAVLWGNGLVTLGQRFVAPPDCLPGYFRPLLAPDAPPLPPIFAGALAREGVETLTVDHPIATTLHPNLTHGHFLLEMLPRLYLLMVLRQYGADIRLALSSRLPDWAKSFALIFEPDAPVVWYDDSRQCVAAPSVVMPAMLNVEHNFHPAMNLMLHDLIQRHGATPDAPTPPRIYLSRSGFGDEALENEAEVEQMFARLGYVTIRLQQMSVEEQIRLFSGAKAIAGEYGSGLHNAIFAGRDTRVIAINFANHYQSKIGRLRGHRLAYVAPEGGGFRHWRFAANLPRTFRVDVDLLRRTALEMTADVD